MTSLPVRLAVALAAGLIAAVAFEPFDWPYLLPVAVAGLTVAVRGAGLRAAFGTGTAFGLVFSGAMTSFLSCAREYAPAGKTGLSIGVVMFFGWIGMAIGAWQGGLFYDLCGDYFTSFANASIAGVANLLILSLLFLYTRPLLQTKEAI